MTQQSNNIDDFLGKRLEVLRQVPERDDQAAALGRERYLAEIDSVLGNRSPEQAVSESPIWRLKGWINNILALQFRRKERVPMLATLMALILSVSMVFGGAGATAFAAQNSLPNDFLYPVKTVGEDARLDLTVNSDSEVDLLLAYADRRVGEILVLSLDGEAVPESVITRLSDHYEAIFLIVTELEEPEAEETLEEVGIHIRQHDRDMIMGRTNAPDHAQLAIARVQAMIRWQAGLVDTGLEDFEAFQLQMRHGPRWVEETPDPEVSETPETSETPEPEDSGYGPGPGAGHGTPACEICTPAHDGIGPGPSNQGDITKPDEGYGPLGPLGTQLCEQECSPSYGEDGSGPMGTPVPSDNTSGSSDSSKDNGKGGKGK